MNSSSEYERLIAGYCGEEVKIPVHESAQSVTGKFTVAGFDGLTVALELRYPVFGWVGQTTSNGQNVIAGRVIEGNRIILDAGFT